MKTPTVKFVLNNIGQVTKNDSSLKSKAAIKKDISEAVALAEKMAGKGLKNLQKTLDKGTTNKMQRAWNGHKSVKRFFGKAPTKIQMNNTSNRLNRVYTRLRDKKLTIRLKSQSGPHTIGHNHGGPLSPRQFVLFPIWFSRSSEQRAATIIHELLHDWHIDHKVKDPKTGKRKTAYGSILAGELAKKKPGNARRNPENIELFCLAEW